MNKINLNIFFLVTLMVLSSCSYPNYLPSIEEIGTNPYGSHILIIKNDRDNIHGELLSVDKDTIKILLNAYEDYPAKISSIPVNHVKNVYVRFAKPKGYGWTIPIFTLFSAFHGWYLVFSVPVNLLVNINIVADAVSSTRYSSESYIQYETVRMYSRFPQGIPANVNLVETERMDY